MMPPDFTTDEAAAFLAAIIDSSDDSIINITLQGIIRSWNRGAEQMFGYSAAEAIGQHIRLIIPPEFHADEENVLARIRGDEKIDHYEAMWQTKDGRRLDVTLAVSPIKDAQGKIIGASNVARDNALRRRAYEER